MLFDQLKKNNMYVFTYIVYTYILFLFSFHALKFTL